MKPNTAALLLIAIVGLSSCSNGTPSTNVPVSSPAAAASADQGAVKVGASSSTVNFLRVIEAAYASTAGGKLNLLEPAQSENIIAGIKQGLVDIGALSRTLKPEEKDGSLEFREVAQDALLVATHSSVTGVSNLTTEHLKGIYSGSITNWKEVGGPDAEIVVLDRPEDESAKRLLRKHYLGDELKNAPNAVVLRKEGELIQTIQSTPYSIGAFSLAHAVSNKLSVNRLKLNDVEPTSANVKAGKYPMTRTITLIWGKKPSESTRSLIDYILSQPGLQVLEQAGFVVNDASDRAKSSSEAK
jgi:phosphate transport system substrate-binding protein